MDHIQHVTAFTTQRQTIPGIQRLNHYMQYLQALATNRQPEEDIIHMILIVLDQYILVTW